jgi:hypothetical protein
MLDLWDRKWCALKMHTVNIFWLINVLHRSIYMHKHIKRKANDGSTREYTKRPIFSHLHSRLLLLHFSFSLFLLFRSRLCTSFQGQFFIFVILSLSFMVFPAYVWCMIYFSSSYLCVHKNALPLIVDECGGELKMFFSSLNISSKWKFL